MSIFSSKLGLALVLAALCLGGRAGHAQSPVSYWIPGWPYGFAGGQTPSAYGNVPAFDGSDARGGGFFYQRYNFSNGWFVGSERGGMGFAGLSQDAALGNFGALSSEGTQFGYNFKNTSLPISIYAGFDTLKYNSGIGNPFAPFESNSGTVSGYGAHAGVEIRPTSNLSLSFGMGYTQQPGDINSLVLPGASPSAARH